MAHVFISYKHRDENFAKELEAQLNKSGFETWRDENIPESRKWRDEIDNQIWKSYAMVVIITPEAIQSQYVNYEWIFALGAKIEVLPIYLREIETFPYRLDDIQYIDFRKEYKWNRLITRLQEIKDGSTDKQDSTPDFIQETVKLLENPDPRRRGQAIDGLALSSHPAALEAIANAVNHHLPDVCINAAFKLVEKTNHTDERALSGLIEGLGGDDNQRNRAKRELLQFDHETITPLILDLLHHDFSEARYIATTILGAIKDKSTASRLLDVLDDKHDKVVNGALEALAQIGNRDSEIISTLRVKLDASSGNIALRTASTLANLDDDYPTQRLIDFIHSFRYINEATSILLKIGNSTIPLIIKALDNIEKTETEIIVRREFIKITGILKAEQAISKLTQYLTDKNRDIRRESIKALGLIGDTSIVATLISMFDDEDTGVREITAWSLGQLGSIEALPKLLDILGNTSEDTNLHLATIYALGLIGDAKATPQLLAKLKNVNQPHKEELVRILVALGEIGDNNPQVISTLIPYLSDNREIWYTKDGSINGFSNNSISELTQQTLRKINTPEALQAIQDWKAQSEE